MSSKNGMNLFEDIIDECSDMATQAFDDEMMQNIMLGD